MFKILYCLFKNFELYKITINFSLEIPCNSIKILKLYLILRNSKEKNRKKKRIRNFFKKNSLILVIYGKVEGKKIKLSSIGLHAFHFYLFLFRMKCLIEFLYKKNK